MSSNREYEFGMQSLARGLGKIKHKTQIPHTNTSEEKYVVVVLRESKLCPDFGQMYFFASGRTKIQR